MTKWPVIPSFLKSLFSVLSATALVVFMAVPLLWADGNAQLPSIFAPKPIVVATIKPIALIAASIAGDDFDVVTLLPPNANPHALAMTITDRQRLADASLVIWLGERFERFLKQPMSEQRSSALELGKVANMRWPGQPGADLHLWLDPQNIELAMVAISRELKALAPLQASAIDGRLTNALAAISKTQADIVKTLRPYQKVPFAVSHDGYGHFVNAFGLMQLEAATQLPEQQISARRMYELQQSVSSARCLIVEPEDVASVKLAQSLKLKAVVVDPLGRAKNIDRIDDLLRALTARFITCFDNLP